MNTNAASQAAAEYLYQTPIEKHLVTTGSYYFNFKFETKSTSGGTVYAQIILDDGATPYYLQNANTWTTTPSYKTITSGTDWSEYLFTTAVIPVDDCDITIKLLEAVSGSPAGVWYKEVLCELIPGDTTYFQETQETITYIDDEYNVTPEDVKLIVGDFPGYTLYCKEAVYEGGHMDSAGDELPNSWHHKGLADDDTLIGHMIADREGNYDEHTIRLSGTLYSKLLRFDKVLTEEINSTTHYFIPTNIQWDTKHCTFSGEWLEVLTV